MEEIAAAVGNTLRTEMASRRIGRYTLKGQRSVKFPKENLLKN
jgi:hypothetical protein